MINFTTAKSAFETYLDGYDRTDDKINLKIIHTYGVIHYASMLADKLKLSRETLLGASPYEVGQTAISPHIADTFFNNECIRSLDRITKMDHWISYIAYFYDINFPESLSVIDNEHFVSRILHRIPYSNKETEAMIEKMEEHMNNYVKTGVTTYDENINH